MLNMLHENIKDEKQALKGGVEMKTDKSTLQHIASLAKLKYTEEEIDKLSADFDKILEHFSNICTEDLADFSFNPEHGQKAVFREDRAEKFESREELLQSSKQIRDGFIVVPKVLD